MPSEHAVRRHILQDQEVILLEVAEAVARLTPNLAEAQSQAVRQAQRTL